MLPTEGNFMSNKSYQSWAILVKDYILAVPNLPYTAVIGSIFACKMVYDLCHLISAIYFKSYSRLSRFQRVEWNNRAISTIHAIFMTIVSLYFVFHSDLYLNDQSAGPITLRSASLSTFALGVSVGYFLSDLGMIFWVYPSLGGVEYVVHHLISTVAVMYAMLTSEGQLYTYMVLISEATTPAINLRWYLDAAGMKSSRAYLINGVVMFISWMVARILLFIYLLCHVYLHYDQVKKMSTFGVFLVVTAPSVLYVMNLIWFGKIIRGLKKTLAKRD
ncbi:Transmembrane protein [Actinidia chinensis var. chinensis]|uniref:Transmembrane protein n=1 Tax=Actinidia chinensis var. chinensis TaxID=1590841 RepID=A0A2R6PBF0_ACTCC|nr:Transmembrane protein [Actinidia chinensis var. chinensis]